jgi:MoxR-like ATPase
MNSVSTEILAALKSAYPDSTQFRRCEIDRTAASLGHMKYGTYAELLSDSYKVRKGRYDYSSLLGRPKPAADVVPAVPATAAATVVAQSMGVASVTNESVYVPAIDPTYIKWGEYTTVREIVKSNAFYPIYIAGLSGNGKTVMVEQACAELKREYVRVQISPETDEDDLIGGFRLIDGNTVFAKGPVVKAMERGAILLVDEIDRATHKIMCLQGVLEGKPILIKKTGEVIHPSLGFNVIATANTKGRGSDDGKFASASIIDEALLERFVATIDQPYPTAATERKILQKHMDKFGASDEQFVDRLVTWAEVIRKTYADEGVDEVISTRRLCHIVRTFSIFNDRTKSIALCISRFDEDTRNAFTDLYAKIDSTVAPDDPAPQVAASASKPSEPPF